MIALLNPRLWIALVLAGVLAFSHLTAYRNGINHAQESCASERAKSERAAQEQAARNRELQRQAEKRYVVQGATREKFFVTTVREVHEAAAPLASCPLPPDLRSLLDAADTCARADPGAPGCTAGKVPSAR